MLTEKQKKICEKYSARDEHGFVHCNECPLVLPDYDAPACKAIMHYDRRTKEWEYDE